MHFARSRFVESDRAVVYSEVGEGQSCAYDDYYGPAHREEVVILDDILMDEHGLDWDDAWQITTSTSAGTT